MHRFSLSYLFFIFSVVAFSQADFVDISEIAGLTNTSNARGVAVCDFDGDGDRSPELGSCWRARGFKNADAAKGDRTSRDCGCKALAMKH